MGVAKPEVRGAEEIHWVLPPESSGRPPPSLGDFPGRAAPIKTREGREVLATADLVAKKYRVRGFAKRLLVTLFGGKGRREWRLALEALRRGVPVPRPVAYGTRRRNRLVVEEWLVSERIPGARDLAKIAREADLGLVMPPSAKRPWIERLAELASRCHDAGLFHDDLHPGNVLASRDSLHLIDLDGARLGLPLERPARIASLAILDRFFFPRASPSDRWRFLVAYAGRDEARAIARELEESTRAGAIRFWRRRIRRFTRENRHVARIASGRLVGWLDRAYEAWGFLGRLADLDRWVSEGEVFKSSRSSTVVRLRDPGTGEALFVKRVEARPSKTLASLFRPSKALRAWRGAWRLVIRDLPTPPPVAVLEERLGPFVLRQYLVTREVSPSAGLDRVLDGFDLPDLARAVGRALRRLAERGLEHGDLKPANVLVHTLPGGRPEIHLIDLESLREGGAPGRGLGRLARWAASDPRLRRTLLLRFLLSYLGPHRPAKERWKRMWRRIAREAGGA